jgi:hypothetical protein
VLIAQRRAGSRREVRRQLPIPNRASWPREARAGKCEVLREPNPTMKENPMICFQNCEPSLTKPISLHIICSGKEDIMKYFENQELNIRYFRKFLKNGENFNYTKNF